MVFLGDSLVSWSSKRQTTVSRSSAEAEYRGVANAVSECTWIWQLLGELHCAVPKATVAYCDNISSVYMARNPVHHRRTKHIELDIHFVREKVAVGELRVLQIPSAKQFADVFTKGFPLQSLRRSDELRLQWGVETNLCNYLRSACDAPRPRSPRSTRGVVIAFRALCAAACARFGLALACNLAVIS